MKAKNQAMFAPKIETLLLKGIRRSTICDIMKNEDNISSASVDRYIRKIKDKWRDNNDKEVTQVKEQVVEQLWMLYNEALNNNDGKEARECLDDIRKINGLDDAQKYEIKQSWSVTFENE